MEYEPPKIERREEIEALLLVAGSDTDVDSGVN